MWRRGRRKSRGGVFVCRHCGAEVEASARACPECGSDDKTGWAEDAHKWTADIPTGYGKDDEFDYDEFIRAEFPKKREKILGIPIPLFILLLAAFVLGCFVVLACLGP